MYFRPSWKWCNEHGKPDVPETVKHFVIIEGHNAMNVLKQSILIASPIAQLPNHKVEVFLVGEFVICVCEEKNLNYFATITELLEPWTKAAENCTIVSLQSLTEFKTDTAPESGLIRAINSKFSDIPALETPNFITGAGAGVGTMRKINNMPFSVYIAYIEIYDITAVKTILGLLTRLGLPSNEGALLRPLHYTGDLYS